MMYEIRADRDVTSKGPEGSGTRRRTVKLPGGSMTLVLGAQPIYLNATCSPARSPGPAPPHQGSPPGTFDPEITIIDLKAERVQEGDLRPRRPWRPRSQPEGRARPGAESTVPPAEPEAERASRPPSRRTSKRR